MTKSWFNGYLSKPIDGPEHQSLRSELWLGGSEAVCRYYLSMLNNLDYFGLTTKQLYLDVVEYVTQYASRKAKVFVFDGHAGEFANFSMPFLKQQFNQAFGIDEELTKEENGMILLLTHPDWTDEQIRISVKTTEKQMNRWPWYRRARAVQSWQKHDQK